LEEILAAITPQHRLVLLWHGS